MAAPLPPANMPLIDLKTGLPTPAYRAWMEAQARIVSGAITFTATSDTNVQIALVGSDGVQRTKDETVA